jgi:tRNA threonylcarbamoyladenosine biosynthesis protein TsaE
LLSSPPASSILETRTAAWPDEVACAETARTVARRPALHDAFVELHGPLGAGKTTFARHLLHGLGVEGAIRSPTYTLMEPYRAAASAGGFDIAHFDFYRFDDPGEWEDAGFRDVFASPGLKLVEWPEKAEGLLPPCDLRISIAPRDGSDARSARFDALSETGRELLP